MAGPRFDFGLALAGAVSGGAYIAGAVDFIVEALDRWQAERESHHPLAPDHETVLCSIAGTSSGSLTAAALVSALQYRFPPVRGDTPESLAALNPLYDSWVNMTDITHLLGDRDRDSLPLQSLFDPSNLDIVARKAVDYGQGIPRIDRQWLSHPLRVSFTVTNLRGVPFGLRCRPSSANPQQTMHADVLRFAVTNFGPHRTVGVRPSERALHFPMDPLRKWHLGGEDFAMAALGSAAFPGALAPRTLHRPTSDYSAMRFAASGGPCRAPRPLPMAPSWSAVNPYPGARYQFAAVDGGVMLNSPVELVRADLNQGRVGRASEQRGSRSKRAVLMIDPMSGLSAPGPSQADGLTLGRIAAALLASLLEKVRFRPAELALAADDTVFSRFIIAPPKARDGQTLQGRDLAGNFLAGFGGYLSRSFRRHDYLLGRHDAQRYLAHVFTLKADNPLFRQWTLPQRQHFGVNGGTELPIIPLMHDLHPNARPEAVPAWPAGEARLTALVPLLERRLDVLYRGLWKPSLARRLLYPLWRWWLRPRITRQVVEAVDKAISAHRLA